MESASPGVTLTSTRHSSVPTLFLATQRYVPEAISVAFLRLMVPPTGSVHSIMLIVNSYYSMVNK